MHPDGLRQAQALIRFYFHENVENENGRIDVDKLSRLWADLQFALQFDGKMAVIEHKKG